MSYFVTVYCERDCIYIREGKCSNTGISIDEQGCQEYIKEELPDIDRPDAERV